VECNQFTEIIKNETKTQRLVMMRVAILYVVAPDVVPASSPVSEVSTADGEKVVSISVVFGEVFSRSGVGDNVVVVSFVGVDAFGAMEGEIVINAVSLLIVQISHVSIDEVVQLSKHCCVQLYVQSKLEQSSIIKESLGHEMANSLSPNPEVQTLHEHPLFVLPFSNVNDTSQVHPDVIRKSKPISESYDGHVTI
jgi:hypothetical protein